MMGPNAFHKQAVNLYQRGLTPEQIAFRLNRSIEAVGVTLYRAGLGTRESLSFLSEAQRKRKLAHLERKRDHHAKIIMALNREIDLLKETEH